MRLAEELVIVLADPGELPRRTLRYAMAGAVLLDLALERCIDTDPERLWPVDPTPLDDDLLDPTLAEIAAAGTDSLETWVRQVARGGDALYDRAVSRLAARGAMQIDDAGVATPVTPDSSASLAGPALADPGARANVLARILATVFQEGGHSVAARGLPHRTHAHVRAVPVAAHTRAVRARARAH